MHTGFLALLHRLSLTCTRWAHGEEVAEPRDDWGLGYLLGLSPPWRSRQEDRLGLEFSPYCRWLTTHP